MTRIKKTLVKFSLTTLAALMISACGSSGGGSNRDPQPITPTQPNQSNVEPSQPAQPNQSNVEPSQPAQQPDVVNPEATPPTTKPQPDEKNDQNANSTEPQPSKPVQSLTRVEAPAHSVDKRPAGYLIPKAEGNVQELFVTASSEDNLNVINVEGKSITLIPLNVYDSISTIIDATKFRYVGGGQTTRLGFVADKDLQNQYLVAYGVNLTNNMPTSGSATYEGIGVHTYSSTDKGIIDDFVQTKAKFTANFSDKTLSGHLTTKSNNVIDISADIDGNQFFGESSAGTITEGRFYGDNAGELTGSYINPKETYLGVYGAQKK
ncbi:hypothetical protein BKK50_01100 [Rodentibacter rarus]|uniref:Transferrin-binding protein B C-lobe/N-lobe beta-barrel domain-containing protein n=1 Tax=Rodentibacter rarus TaxID=1908260 RepID=A0A1V3IRT4_9PAST|nr:transferrin-binding protein-like solute binding protein [Rodentibacter rarus]OOF44821.1 hypothetical protein BKK50_01100 [Rodentibacter rarus]